MARGRLVVEFLTTEAGRPLVRLAGDRSTMQTLRAVFHDMALGSDYSPSFEMASPSGAALQLRQAERGGAYRVDDRTFVFAGDDEQWETRSQLLEPLVGAAPGFQFLDYDRIGPIGVVVTTDPSGRF